MMYSCKINIKVVMASYLDAAPQILRAKRELHSAMSLLKLLMLAGAERTDDSLIAGPELQFSTAKLRIKLLGNLNCVFLPDEAVSLQYASFVLQVNGLLGLEDVAPAE